MPKKVYLVTEERAAILEELIEDYKKRNRSKPVVRVPIDDESQQSPDVYIALTPASGIPAISPDLGEGTGTSSGTMHGQEWNSPGVAICYTHTLLEREIGVERQGDLRAMEGNWRYVWNISRTAIPGNTFILILRDKWGQWIAVNTMGSTSTSSTTPPPQVDASDCGCVSLSAVLCMSFSGCTGDFIPFEGRTVQIRYRDDWPWSCVAGTLSGWRMVEPLYLDSSVNPSSFSGPFYILMSCEEGDVILNAQEAGGSSNYCQDVSISSLGTFDCDPFSATLSGADLFTGVADGDCLISIADYQGCY